MTVDGHHIRVLATGIGWRGALLVALPLTTVDNALSNQLLLLLVIGGAGILLAALLGLLVARTALAPIARFTRQTESIAANPERIEHERLDVTGCDELARLAQTFNQTLDALERSVQSQRNLVADASHELRTPIATIRANLQLMRDEELLSPEDRAALRADVIEELDELTALVADVVELARGSKPSGDPGDVRLDSIVAEALERARRRAPGLTFGQRLEPTLVRGEGDRISRAVTNLLDNAAKWSPAGGEVEVTLHDGVLTVRDHGPGFKEEDLPFVFDRFHRATDARSKPGSGLGLAIVRQAAEAHDGFVEAANAPDGGAILRVGFGPPLELELELEPEEPTRGRSARSRLDERAPVVVAGERESEPVDPRTQTGLGQRRELDLALGRVARDEVRRHPRRVTAELDELAWRPRRRAARAGMACAPVRARRPRAAAGRRTRRGTERARRRGAAPRAAPPAASNVDMRVRCT